MKIIAKGRGKGKTTELIKMSAEKQIPIVCGAGSVDCIIDMAKQMKLEIPKPIIFNRKDIKAMWFGGVQGKVLIDNADDILATLFADKEIEAITMSVRDRDELETDNVKDVYSESIKGLKDDVKNLTKQLKYLAESGKHNEYIACLKALKETMNLIHTYDWQPQFSKYRTNNKKDNGSHYEVATWEQNSDNEIRNHKRYELKSPEDLNKIERHGISCANGKEHTMTNEEMDDFEDKFDKEMNSMKDMFKENLKVFDEMNKSFGKIFESPFESMRLFDNK